MNVQFSGLTVAELRKVIAFNKKEGYNTDKMEFELHKRLHKCNDTCTAFSHS